MQYWASVTCNLFCKIPKKILANPMRRGHIGRVAGNQRRKYMNTIVTIATNEIAVRDDGYALHVHCPNGWSDVVNLKNKVLHYAGVAYCYSGWNSDHNVAYFKPSASYATLS